MTTFLVLATVLASILSTDDPKSVKANPIYQTMVGEGVKLDGVIVKLEASRLSGTQTAEEQQRVLREIAGSERALDDLLRDSVTAPFILKVRDLDTPHGTIRLADLTFAVHADLAKIQPRDAAREAGGQSVEAANMKVSTSQVAPPILKDLEIPQDDPNQWFVHTSAEMLGRIRVEATNQVVVSQEEHALLIASMTDPRFQAIKDIPNFWQALPNRGNPAGSPVPYDGSISYAQITEMKGVPGVLVVETRIAFFEPEDWFDGGPILRSKFAPIAQDQIRRLRRELAQPKK